MTVDNKYFAEKMKEYRKRRKKSDKDFYKRYMYVIEINGQKYVYRSKRDIKVDKVDKNDITPEYIKTF